MRLHKTMQATKPTQRCDKILIVRVRNAIPSTKNYHKELNSAFFMKLKSKTAAVAQRVIIFLENQ